MLTLFLDVHKDKMHVWDRCMNSTKTLCIWSHYVRQRHKNTKLNRNQTDLKQHICKLIHIKITLSQTDQPTLMSSVSRFNQNTF